MENQIFLTNTAVQASIEFLKTAETASSSELYHDPVTNSICEHYGLEPSSGQVMAGSHFAVVRRPGSPAILLKLSPGCQKIIEAFTYAVDHADVYDFEADNNFLGFCSDSLVNNHIADVRE